MIDEFSPYDSMKMKSEEMIRMEIWVEHQVQRSSNELEKKEDALKFTDQRSRLSSASCQLVFLSRMSFSSSSSSSAFYGSSFFSFSRSHRVPILSGNVCYRVVSRGQ